MTKINSCEWPKLNKITPKKQNTPKISYKYFKKLLIIIIFRVLSISILCTKKEKSPLKIEKEYLCS